MPPPPSRRDRAWPAPLMIGACLAMVGAAFLPWLRSGDALRNSFEVVRTADRLDLASGVVQRSLLVGWHLLPMAVGGVLLATAYRRPRVAAGLATGVAALGLLAGVGMATSPLDSEPGAWLMVAAAVVALAASIVVWRSIPSPAPSEYPPAAAASSERGHDGETDRGATTEGGP